MPLTEYRSKRDLRASPEPAGKRPARTEPGARIYVIQKHRASHLHYDFRLEADGVLLSWAIPKGPSLDPSIKRLAMQVEDHPVEYADFEGVIPSGYGAGTVMVWDRGTWQPDDADVDAALRRGDLKFTLFGKKLRGSWVLVRTPSFGGRPEKSWLLIKHRDSDASASDILTGQPRSAISGRLMAEIARDDGGDVAKAADADPQPSQKVRNTPRNPRHASPKRGLKGRNS